MFHVGNAQDISSEFKQIYSLDIRDSGQSCPSSLKLTVHDSQRYCTKSTGSSCNSISIPTNGQSYQYVRGQIKAYQFGTPDAFNTGMTSIEEGYVDGISITHGQNPREYVFTLAVGVKQYADTLSINTCPNTGTGTPQPAFVADEYFCSSGNPTTGVWRKVLYDIPLWSDGANCNECMGPRTFCAALSSSTTDDLELRVCMNEDLSNEDLYIQAIDISIK